MIFANFNALQFWGTLVFTNIVSVVLSHTVTREGSHSYKYRRPKLTWNDQADTGSQVHECLDYRGRAEMIAEALPCDLTPQIEYVTYWNVALTEGDRILVQKDGAIFSLNSSATSRWVKALQQPQDSMPTVLKASTEVQDKDLDGVYHSHHYRRLLTIGDQRGKLAICLRNSQDCSENPWLLIYINLAGKRRQLKLAYDADMAEASRQAVLTIIRGTEKPEGDQWEQATDL